MTGLSSEEEQLRIDCNIKLFFRSGKSEVDYETGFCVFNANLPYALLSSFMTFWCPVIVMVTVYYRVFRSGLVLSLHVSAPEHIWPDDVSAVNVAAMPKGDVTGSQCMNTSVAVAEVRWGRKRRWRWPRSICPPSTDTRGDQPVSISISQFSISSLKSLDRRSLSLEVFFSELQERLGSSEGQAGGAEVQIAAIGGERRFQKNSKLFLHSIFFTSIDQETFCLWDLGAPLLPILESIKTKWKLNQGVNHSLND